MTYTVQIFSIGEWICLKEYPLLSDAMEDADMLRANYQARLRILDNGTQGMIFRIAKSA